MRPTGKPKRAENDIYNPIFFLIFFDINICRNIDTKFSIRFTFNFRQELHEHLVIYEILLYVPYPLLFFSIFIKAQYKNFLQRIPLWFCQITSRWLTVNIFDQHRNILTTKKGYNLISPTFTLMLLNLTFLGFLSYLA